MTDDAHHLPSARGFFDPIGNADDDGADRETIAEIDRLLGHPPRTRFAPGELLVKEGGTAREIWLILEGRVELFRTLDDEDVVFHSETAGRLVGLMSLTRRHPVFFSCRAKEPVVALRLGHEEISSAISRSPEFAGRLFELVLRSLARRNRRSAQLQVKVRRLNRKLERTLTELRATQDKLVDAAKMATLGNLAAGMAHELNNPVAAITRAAGFIRNDLTELLRGTPGLGDAATALDRAFDRPPLSTRDERELKAALTRKLGGDDALAARMISAGVRDATEIPTGKSGREHLIRGGELGGALRHLDNCSQRITDLVRALKLHARDSPEPESGVDVNRTIEDVLTILSNKLRGISVEKDYAALPPITCHPSRLQQVWTNLLVNASQVLNGQGQIRIRTALEKDGFLSVEIEDNGPGIPPEEQGKLFEQRFTTKHGRVGFGLGLGLPISRGIIHDHGGHLTFTSRPGRTCFRAELPINMEREIEPQP